MFSTFLECSQISGVFYHSVIHGLGFFICFNIKILRAKNNKTHFFYVLYSDKTWIFDQSERVLGPIYILICNMTGPYSLAELIFRTDLFVAPSEAELLMLSRQIL